MSKKKRFFSVLSLLIVFSLSFSSLAFAAEKPFYDQAKLDELLNDGLTKEEALQVLRYEDIKNKLTESGQMFDVINEKIVIEKDNQAVNSVDVSLSPSDMEFLQANYDKKKKMPKVTNEAKELQIKEYFEKNPTAVSYKFSFADGTWTEINIINERKDEITSDAVNVYALPNERELATKYWPNDGTYSSTAEWKSFSGVDYAKVFVTQTTYVSNNQKNVKFNGEYCGKGNTGITSASDCSITGVIYETDYYNNPQIWTQNIAKTTFTLLTSHSVSFAGVYSFTVNTNNQWDQYVSIRCSLVASHYYSGIYGVGM